METIEMAYVLPRFFIDAAGNDISGNVSMYFRVGETGDTLATTQGTPEVSVYDASTRVSWYNGGRDLSNAQVTLDGGVTNLPLKRDDDPGDGLAFLKFGTATSAPYNIMNVGQSINFGSVFGDLSSDVRTNKGFTIFIVYRLNFRTNATRLFELTATPDGVSDSTDGNAYIGQMLTTGPANDTTNDNFRMGLYRNVTNTESNLELTGLTYNNKNITGVWYIAGLSFDSSATTKDNRKVIYRYSLQRLDGEPIVEGGATRILTQQVDSPALANTDAASGIPWNTYFANTPNLWLARSSWTADDPRTQIDFREMAAINKPMSFADLSGVASRISASYAKMYYEKTKERFGIAYPCLTLSQQSNTAIRNGKTSADTTPADNTAAYRTAIANMKNGLAEIRNQCLLTAKNNAMTAINTITTNDFYKFLTSGVDTGITFGVSATFGLGGSFTRNPTADIAYINDVSGANPVTQYNVIPPLTSNRTQLGENTFTVTYDASGVNMFKPMSYVPGDESFEIATGVKSLFIDLSKSYIVTRFSVKTINTGNLTLFGSDDGINWGSALTTNPINTSNLSRDTTVPRFAKRYYKITASTKLTISGLKLIVDDNPTSPTNTFINSYYNGFVSAYSSTELIRLCNAAISNFIDYFSATHKKQRLVSGVGLSKLADLSGTGFTDNGLYYKSLLTDSVSLTTLVDIWNRYRTAAISLYGGLTNIFGLFEDNTRWGSIKPEERTAFFSGFTYDSADKTSWETNSTFSNLRRLYDKYIDWYNRVDSFLITRAAMVDFYRDTYLSGFRYISATPPLDISGAITKCLYYYLNANGTIKARFADLSGGDTIDSLRTLVEDRGLRPFARRLYDDYATVRALWRGRGIPTNSSDPAPVNYPADIDSIRSWKNEHLGDSYWKQLVTDITTFVKGRMAAVPVVNALAGRLIPPQPPTGLTATAGLRSLRISFTPPTNTSVTRYDVRVTPSAGGATIDMSGVSSPITVRGITNGTNYNVSLTATNTAGTSSAVTLSGVGTGYTPTLVEIKATPATGSWTVPDGVTYLEYLVVGGGGGSGGARYGSAGGGGGGGMVISGGMDVTPGTSINVTVGAGGTAGTGASGSLLGGGDGGTSSFGSVSALGGSGGGAAIGIGKGGVAAKYSPTATSAGGGQSGGTSKGSGGGGGARPDLSGAGQNGANPLGGMGGAGIFSNLSGSSIEYGKGGDGTRFGQIIAAVAGTANTGNGSKGPGTISPSGTANGALGGSGVVIIRH